MVRNPRLAAWLAVVVVLISLGGCSTSPTRSTAQRYLDTFKGANDTYETVLVAAGRAYRDGLINDAQLEKVRIAGHAAEASLRAAKAALEVYLTTKSDTPTSEMDADLRDLTAAVVSLLHVWDDVNGSRTTGGPHG